VEQSVYLRLLFTQQYSMVRSWFLKAVRVVDLFVTIGLQIQPIDVKYHQTLLPVDGFASSLDDFW
jgi:hypothetical protein